MTATALIPDFMVASPMSLDSTSRASSAATRFLRSATVQRLGLHSDVLLTPSLRKFALTAHVASSVGWLGVVAGFLALAIAGLNSPDAQTVRAAYVALELIGWFVIVPLSFASPLTGLVQSFGTSWGLLRHYWVAIKFVVTIPATLLLLLHMQPVGHLARVVEETTLSKGELEGLRIQLTADAVAAIVVLLIATALSVYKPRGLTAYGSRKQAEESSLELRTVTGRSWGSYALLGLIGLILIVILVHLTGGGLHGH